jgi:hypothetical protein
MYAVPLSPPKASPVVVLVTPVWNDSRRFGRYGPGLARALAESGLPVRWIIADDGSSVREQAELKTMVAGLRAIYASVELDLSGQRTRKGGAICRAWDSGAEADWLAFVDGDGAIDAESMVGLMRTAMEGESNICVVAIRKNTPETPVRRSMIRSIAMRIFSLLARWIVGLHCIDTQCGAKVVPGAAYREVRGKLKEQGFVFDLELLLALERSGCRIQVQAVRWREVPDGKVSLIRDGWQMIAGLLRIRRRLNRGAY